MRAGVPLSSKFKTKPSVKVSYKIKNKKTNIITHFFIKRTRFAGSLCILVDVTTLKGANSILEPFLSKSCHLGRTDRGCYRCCLCPGLLPRPSR